MLLEVSDLFVSYGGVEAVSQVSFSVGEGELVSIIGANGAGKTSILNAVMGLVPPSRGAIRFGGSDITRLASHLRARSRMRIVPERAHVFAHLTVLENLLVGAYGLRKSMDVQQRLRSLYEFFPVLEERSSQLARTLSGGEQQQLSIARALISDPKLLLVDEISMGLMPKLVETVFQALHDLNRRHGLTILLVEQNALASLKIANRGYVLEAGRIVLEGDAADLMRDAGVREAYLGI